MNKKEELLASIDPSMHLTRNFFRDVYACGMADPAFPEKAIAALEAAGCSKARKYYEDWVQQYESEREAMLDGVAHWYADECRKKDRERERKVRNSIAGNRNAGYQFAGFPEDW